MASVDPADYGNGCADFYDEIYGAPNPVMLKTLRQLAGKGPVLELGIGTGRVAQSLVREGLEVTGIEASPAMIDMLRRKPGMEAVQILQGDFSEVNLNKRFSLIYVLASTLCLLPDRSRQAQCLSRTAQHLAPGGKFLIETTVFDSGAQYQVYEHKVVTAAGERRYRVKLCSLPLDEQDRFAQVAGLQKIQHWCSWQREPFAPGSGTSISLYSPA